MSANATQPPVKGVRTVLRWMASLMLFVSVHALAQGVGTVTYVYTDPQGTPLAETDAHGNITATFEYTPYGTFAPTGTTNPGPDPNGPGYTGHVNDPETILVYMQARYYDPVTGQFLSVDPIAPAAANEFNFNRYGYANNNPLLNVDPTGKFPGDPAGDGDSVYNAQIVGIASVTVVRALNVSTQAYYVYADGTVIVQTGARNGRDNNPGNLRLGSARASSTTMASGWDYSPTSATDTVTRRQPFAMFSSPSVGFAADVKTLQKGYGDLDISRAISQYAPSSDHNNPANMHLILRAWQV
ncbi:RHS repeat-associated core domain-containing protein [Dyella monticola]|nr:RHS repeat-associated core domain-containing protein [Dyella monticola]